MVGICRILLKFQIPAKVPVLTNQNWNPEITTKTPTLHRLLVKKCQTQHKEIVVSKHYIMECAKV
jgi:hypothetical protein